MGTKKPVMYSRFQLVKKYFSYWLHASSGKGFGVHSPFVFDFIIHVLNDRSRAIREEVIEHYRKSLLRNRAVIEVKDFGAGSSVSNQPERRIKDIAKSALKKPKYARLLQKIARYYEKKNIIELGTSFGTTAAYLAASAEDARVVTFEGSASVSAIAKKFFLENKFENITRIEGDFEETLPEYLKTCEKTDLAFIDGNHRKDPTVRYFRSICEKTDAESILIFDDIHWSPEMEEAWDIIRSDKKVTLSIDLFFYGIVFFKKEFLEKRAFTIRF